VHCVAEAEARGPISLLRFPSPVLPGLPCLSSPSQSVLSCPRLCSLHLTMDPIYLGGPKPPSDAEPMDHDFVTDDDEEDQLLSDIDVDDSAHPPPPAEPPKPALPSGQELEPDPADDDEPPTPGQKNRKGARRPGAPLQRVPGYSLLPEDRVDFILEENGASTPRPWRVFRRFIVSSRRRGRCNGEGGDLPIIHGYGTRVRCCSAAPAAHKAPNV
jgi:hypothetical protein